MSAPPLGLYVHFPWCLRKCGYCDFASVPAAREAIPHRAYADAVIAELEARLEALAPSVPIATLYVGGGTPSLWEPAELLRVIAAVEREVRSPLLEVTVECNPSSFDAERATRLAAIGVNRVSLGVQSLNDTRLAFLERLHDSRVARRAIEAAVAARFDRISADLIYGIAGQSPSDAAREAATLASLGTTHVSAYTLTIEPGTSFGRRAARGQLPLLPEDDVAESYVAVETALTNAGFDHYEISSFARDGHVSQHNLGYWEGRDYLGLGAAAVGTVTLPRSPGRVRYQNPRRPADYLAAWQAPQFDRLWQATEPGPTVSVEPIDAETALRERLLLGLRLASGLDLETAGHALGVDPWPPRRQRAAQRWLATGQLVREGPRLWIPRGSWLLADGITAALM